MLERALPDGARIVATRTYQISFIPQPDGYRVDGTLVSAEVEAPESLDFLAQLERSRPDTGLFPMHLDGNGILVGQEADRSVAPEVKRAAGHVNRALAGLTLSADQARQAEALVEQLRRNGMHTAWPDDLFRPLPGTRSQQLPVPLPGGATGTVHIDVAAEATQEGLLSRFRRTVVTAVGDSERRTSETWSLAAPGPKTPPGGIILPLR